MDRVQTGLLREGWALQKCEAWDRINQELGEQKRKSERGTRCYSDGKLWLMKHLLSQ